MYSEEEYKDALERMDEIYDAEEGTVEGREADILMKRIEAYEDIHYPIKGTLYD
tara:strand:- start:236 stop:397 length:162 start_codon:yes stop_codon:yes gene_type:complete